jgi:hypothetical protein
MKERLIKSLAVASVAGSSMFYGSENSGYYEGDKLNYNGYENPNEVLLEPEVELSLHGPLEPSQDQLLLQVSGLFENNQPEVYWTDLLYPPPVPTPTIVPGSVTSAGVSNYSSEDYLQPCGGDLPPCWVAFKESRGSYDAVNPRGCYQKGSDGEWYRGCYGKWQFSIPTWGGYMGYEKAIDAPPEIQDAKAIELWDGGNGCTHWNAC